jgi:hypothetical protein
MKSTNELTAKEANAIMIMLEESLESHFSDGFGDIADWEYFDLDAARLTAYQKFRAWYEDKYGARKDD